MADPVLVLSVDWVLALEYRKLFEYAGLEVLAFGSHCAMADWDVRNPEDVLDLVGDVLDWIFVSVFDFSGLNVLVLGMGGLGGLAVAHLVLN